MSVGGGGEEWAQMVKFPILSLFELKGKIEEKRSREV